MEGFQDIDHFVKSLYAAIKKKIPTKVSQLTNDAGYKTTDTNTTYKLSKSGSTVTLTGSDGSTTSVTDSNTTYSSLKNPYSLDIQIDGVTVVSYDGSTPETVNAGNATASYSGLMSKSDKAKLDGIGAGSNVKSVNGKTGAVTLSKEDVGLGNVDNTKDADKPISTAVQTALDAKANNSVATESTDGLMSAADKTKLDGIDPSATGASDSPVEIPIEKLNSITDGTLVVYKIGHLLQIYGSGLSVKRNGSYPDAGVCTIHNFDGLKLGFSISTWTAFEIQSYTFKASASGVVVVEPDGPDIFNVLLLGEPGSSQTGVCFSITIPLLDDKEE